MIRLLLFFLSMVCVFLAGCSGFRVANSSLLTAEAMQEVQEENLSPAEAVFKATERLKEAENSDLGFYSPLHLTKARHKINRANSLIRLRSTKRSRLAAATSALMAIKIIEAAEENKLRVQDLLSDIIDQKKIIDDLSSEKILPLEYKKGMVKVDRLIRLIEMNKPERIGRLQPQVLAILNRLEAGTLKITALKETREMLLKAKSIKAERYAQVTYQRALDQYKKALVFIDDHYKDRKAVASVAGEAFLLAAKAFHVSLETQKIAHTDRASIEHYVLNLQAHFAEINQQVGIENLERHNFRQQVKMLSEGIKTQLAAIKSAEAKLPENEVPLPSLTKATDATAPFVETTEAMPESQAHEGNAVQAEAMPTAEAKRPEITAAETETGIEQKQETLNPALDKTVETMTEKTTKAADFQEKKQKKSGDLAMRGDSIAPEEEMIEETKVVSKVIE